MRKVLADYDVKYFFSTFTLLSTVAVDDYYETIKCLCGVERHTNAHSDVQLLTFNPFFFINSSVFCTLPRHKLF